MVVPALIGAGASILGGIFGASSQSAANKANYEAQKEFAQHGVRWKVRDAKQAGIHPIYALGAQTSSFSPSYVGDTSFGSGVAAAGQDISRAIDATRTNPEKQQAVMDTMNQLQIQRMGLENELLGAQIARVRQPANPPAFPSLNRYLLDGQGDSNGLVTDIPLERINSDPGKLSDEAGAVTERGFLRTPEGFMPTYSDDAKQRLEDDFLGSLAWNLRNRVLPSFGLSHNPPNVPPPEGTEWRYDIFSQQYVPMRQSVSGAWFRY